MKLAVMQPYFFPYLGYFSLIDSVDEFMFFDDVQYIRKSWMSRNRLINTSNGVPFYIRPGIVKPNYGEYLQNVKINNIETSKHFLFEQLKSYKSEALYYSETISLLEEIFEGKYEFLSQFNIESIRVISKFLGLKVKFSNFSDYGFWFETKPEASEWGLFVAKELSASEYINAPGGEKFILPEPFIESQIKLGFIEPNLVPYAQGKCDFIPGLSIIDVLMFNGRERTRDMVVNYRVNWK